MMGTGEGGGGSEMRRSHSPIMGSSAEPMMLDGGDSVRAPEVLAGVEVEDDFLMGLEVISPAEVERLPRLIRLVAASSSLGPPVLCPIPKPALRPTSTFAAVSAPLAAKWVFMIPRLASLGVRTTCAPFNPPLSASSSALAALPVRAKAIAEGVRRWPFRGALVFVLDDASCMAELLVERVVPETGGEVLVDGRDKEAIRA